MMLPEGRRAELEARGQHHGARGRHNVARGQHIFQWPEATGVILTLSYTRADIDTGILTVLKSNMQTCDIGSNISPRADIGFNIRPRADIGFNISPRADIGINITRLQYC